MSLFLFSELWPLAKSRADAIVQLRFNANFVTITSRSARSLLRKNNPKRMSDLVDQGRRLSNDAPQNPLQRRSFPLETQNDEIASTQERGPSSRAFFYGDMAHSPITEQGSPYDADNDSPSVNLSVPPLNVRGRDVTPPAQQTHEALRAQAPIDSPPAYYSEDPVELSMSSLRITDPIPRSTSAMGTRPPLDPRRDPIPRSASVAPNAHRPSPQHSNTVPAPERPVQQGYQQPNALLNGSYGSGPSRQYAASAYSRNSDYDGLPYDNEPRPGPEQYRGGPPAPNDNINGYHRPPQSPQQQQPYGRPQVVHPQQYSQPPPMPRYDPLYAAASDLLGLPPGAAAPAPPNPQTYQSPYPSQQQQIPAYYNRPPLPQAPNAYLQPGPSDLTRGHSNASSLQSLALSSASMNSSLRRSDTVMTGAPIQGSGRQTTKAVDLNQPPYTKEYVDQYRARLKGDPDPETHFAFAKYLIEAAKKIGAGSSDQRGVRKYRDQLITESLKVIRRLATQGETYSEAQFFLANCYGTGMLGLEMDHDRAYHLYLQASRQNHAQACYRVAVCNEIGAGTKRDHPRAFAFYRKAASLGDTAAMYKLGMILLTGSLSQPKNPRDAIPWLRRAAEQADEENPHALHELGLLYEQPQSGAGVIIPDPNYAKELFTQAAHLGYTQSQFKLGSCYEYGTLGCPLDPKRSIAWYTKAAEKGDSEAELALSGWYLTGSDGVLQQSDQEAYLWARKAANKGLAKAEYAVGYYTEMGIGAKVDIDVAKRWYMRAAAQGNTRSMNRLTELKREGARAGRRARPTRQQANDEGCIIA